MAKAIRKTTLALCASFALGSAVASAPRGFSMEQVRLERGEPLEIIDAVGDPPITRWRYSDEIVYFEYDKVIVSVPANGTPELQRRDGLRPIN